MSTFEIKNRWTRDVLFACELDASLEDESLEVRLGAAVKMAFGRGADLCDADLRGANLRGADLCDANLRGASLCGAILRDADLRGASLCDANLYGANLRGASLCGAILRGASLCDANLYGADLYGADLRGADLYGASYGEGVPLTREPIFISGLRFPIYIFDEHIKIGCELHRISGWESYGDREIIEMDGREGAREWRTHKAWLLEVARKHQSLCAADPDAA